MQASAAAAAGVKLQTHLVYGPHGMPAEQIKHTAS